MWRRILLLASLAAAPGCGSSVPPCAGAACASEPLTVATDRGPVAGKLAGSTRAFLGIPFAAPPVGSLRWKSPVPHDA